MNTLRLALICMLLLIMCPNSFGQQVSNDELIAILGIKVWRVPLPKDDRFTWGIEIVDYTPRKYTGLPINEQIGSQQKALISLRDIGDSNYEFTLNQRRGISRGMLKVDLCENQNQSPCDNSYALEWYDVPKAYDNGTRFVLADIRHMLGKDFQKQIILVIRQSRL